MLANCLKSTEVVGGAWGAWLLVEHYPAITYILTDGAINTLLQAQIVY